MRRLIGLGWAQKLALEYDQPRQQFYALVYSGAGGVVNYFWRVNMNGHVIGSRQQLTTGGSNALGGTYPCLSLRDGILHYGWTTDSITARPNANYYDMHYAQSPDGGASWRKMNRTPLSLPIVADDTGPTDLISLPDEADKSPFGANMLVRAGKAHFMYAAHVFGRQHYVRYDLATARRDIDIQPSWIGEQLRINHLDGFFCARASDPGSTIYAISGNFGEDKVNCLASDDDGVTWYDYAQSVRAPAGHTHYSHGGNQEITNDNYILGHVTAHDGTGSETSGKPYFFKIKAGLSRAYLTEVSRVDPDHWRLIFDEIRGQPVEVRFRREQSSWTGYMPFSAEMNIETSEDLLQYQFTSRLGVDSDIFDVPPPAPPRNILISENWNSCEIDSAKWLVSQRGGAQCALGQVEDGDCAIYTVGGPNPADDHHAYFYSRDAFSRGGNLRCTFKTWGDPSKTSSHHGGFPQVAAINGPWRYTNAGIAPGNQEACVSLWLGQPMRFSQAEWDTGHIMSAPYTTVWLRSISESKAITVRVWLGDGQGAKCEWSTDNGNNWMQEIDTRGVSGGDHPNVYLGFATVGGAVFIDDIVVEKDLREGGLFTGWHLH